MSIIRYLDFFLGAMINLMCYVIIIKKVYKINLNSNNKKVFLPLILCSFVTAIINIENKNMFKPLFIIPIFSVGIKFIINKSFNNAFIMTIIGMFYLFLSELLFALFCSFFKIEWNIIQGLFGSVKGNIAIAIFVIPFLFIKPLRKYLNNLTNWLEKEKKLGFLILILFFIGVFLSRSIYSAYNKSDIIMNIILIIIFTIVIYLFLNECRRTEELSNNYNMLFSYLKVYEKELDEKRKIIHDYNNQLIVISGYISEKNEKLKNYINLIVKDQKKITDNSIIKNTDKLPVGLKGLIYYKIATLSKNVKVNIEVDSKLKNIIISDELSHDYLKIVGVFLDNAIEAAVDSKEKRISINAQLDNKNMKLIISNSFSGDINVDRIYNLGYSTKGDKRGYGLNLVNEIIRKQRKIKTAIKIENNQFIAIQSIKIK